MSAASGGNGLPRVGYLQWYLDIDPRGLSV